MRRVEMSLMLVFWGIMMLFERCDRSGRVKDPARSSRLDEGEKTKGYAGRTPKVQRVTDHQDQQRGACEKDNEVVVGKKKEEERESSAVERRKTVMVLLLSSSKEK